MTMKDELSQHWYAGEVGKQLKEIPIVNVKVNVTLKDRVHTGSFILAGNY